MNMRFALIAVINIAAVSVCDGHKIFAPDTNFCNMTCYGQPHTLCDKDKGRIKADNVSDCQPNLSTYISPHLIQYFRRTLLRGHNGIRNRIAEKMGVANMVQMSWDYTLQVMAEKFLRRCVNIFVDDPCTTIDSSVDEPSYELISQNRFFTRQYYMRTLVQAALRSWYYEKDSLNKPTLVWDDEEQVHRGILYGENNFTHLANPITFAVGCVFERLNKGYILICNYYPHVHADLKAIFFLSGEPASICPYIFPLKNPDFEFSNLCIGIHINAAHVSTLSGSLILSIMAALLIY